MSRVLYFDCFSGASGDMILGALLDAGLPLDALRAALGSLATDVAAVRAEKVMRGGLSATKFRVDGEREEPHVHAGAADSHEGRHRTLAEIGALIDRAALSTSAKTRARELFHRLGEVEAAIHGTSIDTIHLHEVGAIDSIIDIVGTVFALEWFDADIIVSSPLNVGEGMVNTAHGVFPVPAPATVKLLEGVPIYASGAKGELVTPTGALLIASYASSYGPTPAMSVERVGYGAGNRNPKDTPNVLRVMVGQGVETPGTERITVIECEIDDMNPQIFGSTMDLLYAAGALEVYFSAVQMKKNRPGTLLTVLSAPADRAQLTAIVFRETTTIGLRYHDVMRERLERTIVSISTALGPIRFKIARFRGGIVNAAPEFDDCRRLAEDKGVSVKDVQAIAMKAYLDTTTT